MENSNNPAPAGTADTQADSQVPENLTQAELEDEIGAAFEASLEESEQAEKTEANPAKDETPPESNEEAEKKESETEEEPEEEAPKDEKKSATIKLDDGTETTLEELVKGNLRQADYTRKTQEVAEQRRQLESAAQTILHRVKGREDLALDVLSRYAPKKPDISISNTDPVGYMQQKDAYDRAKEDFDRLSREKQEAARQVEEQQQREKQALIAREKEILFQKMPELQSKEHADTFWNETVKIAEKAWDLTAEDIGNITDHRAILVLKDALAYRKSIVAKRMESVQAAKNAPPIKTAARPGSNIANARAQKADLERLRNSGSVDDAVASAPDEWFGI